jgi:large subunit ribosomal protein LP0
MVTDTKAKKKAYMDRLRKYFNEYEKILLISVDNVGSSMLQDIRIALRGTGVVLMGKNTIIRKVLREEAEKRPELESIIPNMVGNVGFCFTNGDLKEVRSLIGEFRVPAAARSGAIAPDDVIVKAGPTGMDPGQTAYFQTLNVPTKISRGCIEISTDVHLIRKGEKISSSAVSLLKKLGQKPFFYFVVVKKCFEDGSMFDVSVLDVSNDDIVSGFMDGVNMVARASLAMGYPTLASMPHSISRAFQMVTSFVLATEYEVPECAIYKDMALNPDAYAVAVEEVKEEVVEEVKEEVAEESSDASFDLFD